MFNTTGVKMCFPCGLELKVRNHVKYKWWRHALKVDASVNTARRVGNRATAVHVLRAYWYLYL